MEREDWTKAIAANRVLWNELTVIHSKAYRVDDFKAGRKSLDPLVKAELGDVKAKKLLHLQCHFGMDTLSLARHGAEVTGVDLAEDAITLARDLAGELDLRATFIHSNLYDLPSTLPTPEAFDLVFSSWGVLTWLPDLTRWAQIIAYYLKPGGIFYLADSHPFLQVFDNEADTGDLRVTQSYFQTGEPRYYPPSPDYADPKTTTANPSYEFSHNLSEIHNALSSAGLQLEFFHEHPFCTWDYFSFMERGSDHLWYLPPGYPSLPLSFSLQVRKSLTP